MKDLEVGMYVRTDMGDISKIKSIWENERVFFENYVDIDWFTSDSFGISYLKKCKVSNSIIDLIEVGDYVDGYKVTDVYKPDGNEVFRIEIERNTLKGHIIDKSSRIKSIVTKEQFKDSEYVVE